ncbi:MAG TPA: hypothetical protein PK073_13140 [Ignavibacteriaceae bacterium]|nr:hypothetical protein [Ignavibacteriaceae bacterium]
MCSKKIILSVLIFSIYNLLISCSESVEPTKSALSYVPITVGDERQIVFTEDSSTIFYEVTGTVNRSDGMEVYKYSWYYGTDTIRNIEYYGIKDGFFISTKLDTVRDSSYYLPSNPYFEQKLAKLYPNNGDTWQSIPGDSSSLYFIAQDIGTQHTFAGTFNNCYGYRLDNIISANYSKGIGHIASTFPSYSFAYLSSYIKVNNRVYGSKMPAKDPTIVGNQFKKRDLRLLSILFGQK